MPSYQYKMISGMFKLIGVNKMLDKEGTEFERLLENYKEKIDIFYGTREVMIAFLKDFQETSKSAMISNVSNKISVLEKRNRGR